MRHMKEKRSRVNAVSYKGFIYIVGGWDGNRRLRSAEMYDPILDKWTMLPEMQTPRASHDLAVINGCIIVVGGYANPYASLEGPTALVEMLDLGTLKWRRVESLPEPRFIHSCCVLPWKSLGDNIARQIRAWDQPQQREESERMENDNTEK